MVRWFRLLLLTWLLSPWRTQLKRRLIDGYARLVARKPVLTLYYEVGDPQSHLSAQLLYPLSDLLDAEIEVVIVPPEAPEFRPNPLARAQYRVQEAAMIAPALGLSFPKNTQPAEPEMVAQASRMLLAANNGFENFLEVEKLMAPLLWFDRDRREDPPELPDDLARLTETTAKSRLQRNLRVMQRRGGRSAPAWYFRGEWFSGLMRMRHLQLRLQMAGAFSEKKELPLLRAKDALLPSDQRVHTILHCYFRPEDPNSYLSLRPLQVLQSRFPITVEYHLLPTADADPDLIEASKALLFPSHSLTQLRDAIRDAVWRGIAFGKMAMMGDRTAWARWFEFAKSQKKAEAFVVETMQAQWSKRQDMGRKKGVKKIAAGLGIQETMAETAKKAEEVTWNTENINENSGWSAPMFRLGEFVVHGRDSLWLIEETLRRRFQPQKPAPKKRNF